MLIPSFSELKVKYLEDLRTLYAPEEILEFYHWLLNEYCKLSKIEVHLNGAQSPTELQFERLEQALLDLKRSTPIQYILGYTYFLDLKIMVNPSTLIPRPETEELVLYALESKDAYFKGVLDLCTGSGCIALALKQNCPNLDVYAYDISLDALKMAHLNTENLNLDVKFSEVDVLMPFFEQPNVDVWISNPPYVLYEEQQTMHTNVLNYEPHLALFVENENPLLFYTAIFEKWLKSSAQFLFFEMNPLTINEFIESINNEGLLIEVRFDFRGKQRFLRLEKSVR